MFNKTSVGFHTVSIQKRLPTRSYTDDILHILGNTEGIKTEKTPYNPNHFYAKYVGKNKGIYWKIRFDEVQYKDKKGNKKENRCYFIEAVINPKIIVGETDYITAANESYIAPMIAAYNTIASEISPLIPSFKQCTLKEIHYCVNFRLSELYYPYTVKQVMKLFKCAYIPKHYKELKYYCNKSHRMKELEHSFYLISKSVVVNCYDKQAKEIKTQEKYPHLDLSSRIVEAEGILRFEIQFKYNKIYNLVQDIKDYMMKKYNMITDINDYMASDTDDRRSILRHMDIVKILLSDDMSKSVIYKYFDRIIGFGDYFTLAKAKEEILKNCRSPKAERLITILEFINQNRGIHKAKAKLDADVEAAKKSKDKDAFAIAQLNITDFCIALRNLNELNINGATISKDDKIPYMTNLMRVYLEMNGISLEDMKTRMRKWDSSIFYLDLDI